MSPGTRSRGKGARPLLARTALSSLLLLSASSLPGCDRTILGPSFVKPNPEASGGSAGATAGGTTSAAGTSAGPVLVTSPACQLPVAGTPVFSERAVSNLAPARRELYTWTTAEQAQEVRAGSVLLTRTEREGLGPGYAMEALAALALTVSPDPHQADVQALAALLTGPDFDKARYAWSEPWATRVGWPGETYGDQLIRMVLRPEAWLALYSSGTLNVVDMQNMPVALADALAQPERLAGVFFVRDGADGGPYCGGSFRGGSDGYREFIIGNESMIEEWSLGTPEIRARLESDIALVQAFFERIRPCPPHWDAESFNIDVCCGWARATPRWRRSSP